jgi:MFS family permease
LTRSYKIGLLTSLYLAQGLPYGFFTQALPVLLREAGLSLTMISATSLLFLPWALKFLWAPVVDQVGTRRQWLLFLQSAGVAGALVLASLKLDGGSLLALFVAAFLFNLVAATQDIATDGLAVRILDVRERGLANGIQVGAYRVGMILGGGLLLWIYAKVGWSVMFLCMAALLALTILPVLWLREPRRAHAEHTPFAALAAGWVARLRVPGFLAFVALICFYKFGDSMVASLIGPFMKDAGLATEAIALMKGTVGSVASLAGAAAGGWFAYALGRRAALLVAGLLQTASLGFYVAAAAGTAVVPMLWAGSVAEHLLGGMASVALFTLMMDASDPEHAGTDYTLLACAIVVAMGLANFSGAVVADTWGYWPTFVAGTVLSGIGCLTLVIALDLGAGPRRLAAVWAGRGGPHHLDASAP